MSKPLLLSALLLLCALPGGARACEFHGGPWGMAFARMMHAGGDPGATDAGSGNDQAAGQADAAALATLRAQFLQRFHVKVEDPVEAQAAAPSGPAAVAQPVPALPPR